MKKKIETGSARERILASEHGDSNCSRDRNAAHISHGDDNQAERTVG